MAPQDHVGRIPRDAFVVSSPTEHPLSHSGQKSNDQQEMSLLISSIQISTAILFGMCVLAIATRSVLRFWVQKQTFSLDDGFLFFAFACLLTAIVVVYKEVLHRMYYLIALQSGVPGVFPVPDALQIAYEFHKYVTVGNMTSWTAVMAVKFSFMCFFKKLIDRMPHMNKFWWVVILFHLACLGYGLASYYIGCPFYYDPRSRKSYSFRWRGLTDTKQLNVILASTKTSLSITLSDKWFLTLLETC